jgi:hypothetical protein
VHGILYLILHDGVDRLAGVPEQRTRLAYLL